MAPGQAKRAAAAVPGGSCQYCTVQPYSVVRHVWGRGGVGGFLISRGPTPPHNPTAVILPTPVRCTKCASGIVRHHNVQGKSTLKVTRAANGAGEALSYNSSPSMQLPGDFGTLYVILSECAGAMPMAWPYAWCRVKSQKRAYAPVGFPWHSEPSPHAQNRHQNSAVHTAQLDPHARNSHQTALRYKATAGA